MAVVGPSRHSRVSMSVSMSLMQGGGAGATGGGGTTGAHPGQAVLAAAAQAPPTYYHPTAPAPPPPPPAQDLVQPDRPIGYGAFGVVWWVNYTTFFFNVMLPLFISNIFCVLMSGQIVEEIVTPKKPYHLTYYIHGNLVTISFQIFISNTKLIIYIYNGIFEQSKCMNFAFNFIFDPRA